MCEICGPEIVWHPQDVPELQPPLPKQGGIVDIGLQYRVVMLTDPDQSGPHVPDDVFIGARVAKLNLDPAETLHYVENKLDLTDPGLRNEKAIQLLTATALQDIRLDWERQNCPTLDDEMGLPRKLRPIWTPRDPAVSASRDRLSLHAYTQDHVQPYGHLFEQLEDSRELHRRLGRHIVRLYVHGLAHLWQHERFDSIYKLADNWGSAEVARIATQIDGREDEGDFDKAYQAFMDREHILGVQIPRRTEYTQLPSYITEYLIHSLTEHRSLFTPKRWGEHSKSTPLPSRMPMPEYDEEGGKMLKRIFRGEKHVRSSETHGLMVPLSQK